MKTEIFTYSRDAGYHSRDAALSMTQHGHSIYLLRGSFRDCAVNGVVPEDLLHVGHPDRALEDNEALQMVPLGLGADFVLADHILHFLLLIGVRIEVISNIQVVSGETPVARGRVSHFNVRVSRKFFLKNNAIVTPGLFGLGQDGPRGYFFF